MYNLVILSLIYMLLWITFLNYKAGLRQYVDDGTVTFKPKNGLVMLDITETVIILED